MLKSALCAWFITNQSGQDDNLETMAVGLLDSHLRYGSRITLSWRTMWNKHRLLDSVLLQTSVYGVCPRLVFDNMARLDAQVPRCLDGTAASFQTDPDAQ